VYPERNIIQRYARLVCVGLLSVLVVISGTRAFCAENVSDAALNSPSITDISIINDNTMLYVNFRLENGFTPEVEGALRSGIPLTFLFDVALEIPGIFMDTTVVSRRIRRKIKYDTLKGEYMVSFDPSSPRVIMVNNEDAAAGLISQVNHISLTALSSLERNEVYRLRVRAGVEKEDSSIAFTGILNVFSSWGYWTDWYEVVFNY
jgi:hypothetical protein